MQHSVIKLMLFVQTWFFLNTYKIYINMLLIHQKSAKFKTNFWKMNFPHKRYFLNAQYFKICYYFLKVSKICEYLSKYKLSPLLKFFNCMIFFFSFSFINTLFYRKSTKFTIFRHWLSKYEFSSQLMFFKWVFLFHFIFIFFLA